MMKKKLILDTMALALLLVPLSVDAKAKKKQSTENLSTLEIIDKVNSHWQAVNAPETNAFWDNAVYFTGNMEAYKLTGNAKYLEYSDKWARHNKWSGATEQDPAKWQYKTYGEDQQHVLFADWQTCFQTYLDMYSMNPDAYKIQRVKEVMTREAIMTQTDFWWWIDALYMAMPVMTKMYNVTGDVMYLDKLYANFKFADDIMFDKDAHLYYRDAKYVYPAHKTESGKKDFWARGNGWAMAAFAKVLADLPENYSHRAIFVEHFRQLAEAVSKCQQKDGYWTRSMIDPKQAEGPETSGTALFTYALLWGMNNGLLDRAVYGPIADKAWLYLSTYALQSDGSVGYVQPIGEKAIKGQKLAATNVANFGTGAFLLAACEKVRYDDGSVNPVDDKLFTVEVTNTLPSARQEVVELDAKTVFNKLSISGGRQFQVYNAVGQQVPYQITHDGKVLIDVAVRPNGTATFTFKKGTPKVFVNTCYGRMYPERVDDIAWENDRTAYRCYGPALQRSGERAFGNDVWVKNTPNLVVEERYYIEDTNKDKIAELKKTDPNAAKALEMATTYHFDQGNGLDCYKVGPMLGCGTPALIDGDSIYYPYCYKDYEILDNGPLRFSVKLVYNPSVYKSDKSVVENRILSLDKNSNFNKMTVWYDGLTVPADMAVGIALHSEDVNNVVLGKDYIQYADPTDNPQGQNFQIFVGTLFPNGVSETRKVMIANPSNGNAGHALGILKDYKSGQKYTYYFGSAWSKYDCRTQAEWQNRVTSSLENIKTPLTVEIK